MISSIVPGCHCPGLAYARRPTSTSLSSKFPENGSVCVFTATWYGFCDITVNPRLRLVFKAAAFPVAHLSSAAVYPYSRRSCKSKRKLTIRRFFHAILTQMSVSNRHLPPVVLIASQFRDGIDAQRCQPLIGIALSVDNAGKAVRRLAGTAGTTSLRATFPSLPAV